MNMNIIISYKQTWVDIEELEYNLKFLRKTLEDLGHKTFIYFLDDDSEKTASYIMQRVKDEIEKADLFLCFINHKEKSEGMLLELWEAYALWKEIILLVNNKFRGDYYLSYATAKETLYFDKIHDLKEDLENLLKDKE